MNAVIMKHRCPFISTHLRSIWWLLKTLDHSVSIKSPSMKPLEQRISTHLAAWGNNGGGRGGMEQMTTERLHSHMINRGGWTVICYAKQGDCIQHRLCCSHCCNRLTCCKSKMRHVCLDRKGIQIQCCS